MRCRTLMLATCLAFGWPGWAFSQAFIEHLDAPVVQRGAVTRLTIRGTDANGAVGLWTSLPHDALRLRSIASSDQTQQAVLDVELSASAPLGLYGLRLATRSGLSNVHLFLVDELPVTTRPADLPGDGVQAVSLPVCVTGSARPATVDRYAISVQQGQRIAFEVIGNRLGKDYDPLIQIRNASGKLVAECDNSVGLFFDCRFAHTFADAGAHVVEVRDSRFDGHPTWHYVLRMGDFPDARVAVPSAVKAGEATTITFPQVAGLQLPVNYSANHPLETLFHEVRATEKGIATWVPVTVTDLAPQVEVEPNDAQATATSVKVPGTLNGVLGLRGESDWFAFELTQGQKLQFQGVSRLLGSAADLELVLFDADGREVRRVDDMDTGGEGGFAFQTGKAGLHRLQVRDMTRDGGPAFAYRVEVRAGGPQFQLLADAPDLTVPQGNYQPLPIKVTRTDFGGEIRLELKGAPPGIALEPTVIPAGVTDFVGRISAAASAAEGIYTLQVVGSATVEGAGSFQALAVTKPLVDRQLKNVDLIPYALREDQQLLPPSLTNQIALMVTPPTPYSIELPAELVHLTRFQTADFVIATTRQSGFASPITFAVKGGQIGNEAEERNQVYARFTPATSDHLQATGTFFNRINTQLNKHRVDLTATAEFDGRRVNIIRSFTLDVRSAFQPTYEPAQPTVEPGGVFRFKILANRVSTFDGPLTFTLGPHSGFQFPETVELPKGQPSVDVELKVDPQLNPGRHDLRMQVAGFVNKYEESINIPNLSVEVKKGDGK